MLASARASRGRDAGRGPRTGCVQAQHTATRSAAGCARAAGRRSVAAQSPVAPPRAGVPPGPAGAPGCARQKNQNTADATNRTRLTVCVSRRLKSAGHCCPARRRGRRAQGKRRPQLLRAQPLPTTSQTDFRRPHRTPPAGSHTHTNEGERRASRIRRPRFARDHWTRSQ